MDRIQLIENLLIEKRKATMEHSHYLTTVREYDEKEKLYMREVHFVSEIGPTGKLTMSELAAKLDITQGAVSQLAGRLEKKQYIIRERSAEDSRRIVVSLTEKGRELYEHHVKYDLKNHQLMSERLEMYSDEDLERLITYEKVMQTLFR